MEQAPPGWYVDPYDAALERAWDGAEWMNETRRPPGNASAPPAANAWGAADDVWPAPIPEWSPPSEPDPDRRGGTRLTSPLHRPTVVAVIVGAVMVLAIGFASGYATSSSRDPRRVFYVPTAATATTPSTGTQPADVNVPGPTAPAGVDTVGFVAEQDLSMAASAVTTFFQVHPGTAPTVKILQAYNSQFAYDDSGTTVGAPQTVGGPAVISAAIDHLSGAPRRVVLALPGKYACYYVMVTDGAADQFGVARSAAAVSHCFAAETPGSVPQVRPETKWTLQWPAPRS